jgi:2-succinyl-6-hydroxy-2,4-cyclohexadiene-1-carboxylate synthase
MFEFSTLTCGDLYRPPLIFLHGFLGAKEDWEGMLSYFEKHFFCIAFDLPGHGSTPYSDNILSVLKTAVQKIASTHMAPILIGYSMGGRIVLQLQEHAAAVIALSAHLGLATEGEKAKRRKIDEAWREKLLKLPFDAFFYEWCAQPIFQNRSRQRNLPLLQLIVKRRMKQNPQDLARVMQQLSLANQPHITQFLCPTLLLYGEEDLKYRQLYCRLAETDAKLQKTVSVRGIKNCGHAIHLEDAPKCAEEMINWLEKIYEHS